MRFRATWRGRLPGEEVDGVGSGEIVQVLEKGFGDGFVLAALAGDLLAGVVRVESGVRIRGEHAAATALGMEVGARPRARRLRVLRPEVSGAEGGSLETGTTSTLSPVFLHKDVIPWELSLVMAQGSQGCGSKGDTVSGSWVANSR